MVDSGEEEAPVAPSKPSDLNQTLLVTCANALRDRPLCEGLCPHTSLICRILWILIRCLYSHWILLPCVFLALLFIEGNLFKGLEDYIEAKPSGTISACVSALNSR